MEDETEEWSLSIVNTEEGRRIYRMRQQVPAAVVHAEYEHVIMIEWRFPQEMPDKKTHAAQVLFEDLMDPLGEDNVNSLLMMVCTGTGFKEWCYYAKSYDQFLQELNDALMGKPRFPIDILHDKDKAWKYWNKIKEYAEGANPQA